MLPSAPGFAHMLCVLPRQGVSCGSPNLELDLLSLRTMLSVCVYMHVSVCVYVCVCLCVHVCVCACVCVWSLRVFTNMCVFHDVLIEDRLQESVLSFHCVGPWD